jgi:hypothetical protein
MHGSRAGKTAFHHQNISCLGAPDLPHVAHDGLIGLLGAEWRAVHGTSVDSWVEDVFGARANVGPNEAKPDVVDVKLRAAVIHNSSQKDPQLLGPGVLAQGLYPASDIML